MTLVTYARLGTSSSPEENDKSSFRLHSLPHHQHHQHHRPFQRTLLLVLLFLLLLIFIFTFTLLLLLLLGDVRHQQTSGEVLLFESSVFEEELLSSSSSSAELSLYGQAEPTVQVSRWRAIEARLPKFDRKNAATFEAPQFPSELLNLHNFSFSRTAERTLKRCRSMRLSSPVASLNLVILIHSAVEHFAQRQRLRRSWLALDDELVPPGARISHAFILGRQKTSSEGDERMMTTALSVESRLYGDTVQVNGFLDSYNNLTYKHLAGLRWAVQYGCAPVADYLLKVDDDAFVDMYAVLRYLAEGKAKHSLSPSPSLPPPPALLCSLFPEDTAPKRTGKWALNYSTYPFEVFPAYCSGVGYFIRPQLAADLLATSSKWHADHYPSQPVIPIDDVFVTGLLRSTLRPPVKATAINGRYVYDVRKLRRWLKDADEDGGDCPSGYLIGDIGNELDAASLVAKLWSKTERAWRRHQASEDGRFSHCPQMSTIVTVSSL